MTIIDNMKNSKCWWACRAKEILYIIVRNVKWYSHGEKQWWILRKLKLVIAIWSDALAFGYTAKGIKISMPRGMCNPMFFEALLLISKATTKILLISKATTKHQSVTDRILKGYYKCTKENYLVFVSFRGSRWMVLSLARTLCLLKLSQMQKINYYRPHQ